MTLIVYSQDYKENMLLKNGPYREHNMANKEKDSGF